MTTVEQSMPTPPINSQTPNTRPSTMPETKIPAVSNAGLDVTPKTKTLSVNVPINGTHDRKLDLSDTNPLSYSGVNRVPDPLSPAVKHNKNLSVKEASKIAKQYIESPSSLANKDDTLSYTDIPVFSTYSAKTGKSLEKVDRKPFADAFSV